jgi:hypothetical protein
MDCQLPTRFWSNRCPLGGYNRRAELSGGRFANHVLREKGFIVLLRSHLVRGEEPDTNRPIPDPKLCRDLPQAVALCLQLQNSISVHCTLRPTKHLPIGTCIPYPRTYALTNQISLQLRYGTDYCEKCRPKCTGRVDILLVRNKLYAE